MGQSVPDCNDEATPSPSRVVRKIIGARRLAEVCGRTTDAIRKWDRAKSKGGTGGLIPAEFQARILRIADEEELPLGPRDLIGEPEQ